MYDDWIPFEDGMTILMQMPKFRDETENIGSIHITLNGTKVGGSKVTNDSFWKSWKHEPLSNGTYVLQIQETPDSAVILSTTIKINS